MPRIYRIQDNEGRGPFRPGFSRQWADEVFAPGMIPLPTFMEEFGCDIIDRLGRPAEFFGSGVRKLADLGKWFSTTERQRLAVLGFGIRTMKVSRILAESENQLVFARSMPLTFRATLIPWSELP